MRPLLQNLNLGSSVAEFDDLLNVARVDTSAFSDIFYDRGGSRTWHEGIR
jgi:hypothetical protein